MGDVFEEGLIDLLLRQVVFLLVQPFSLRARVADLKSAHPDRGEEVHRFAHGADVFFEKDHGSGDGEAGGDAALHGRDDGLFRAFHPAHPVVMADAIVAELDRRAHAALLELLHELIGDEHAVRI